MGLLPFEEKAFEILVKREVETSDKYGLNPKDREVKDILSYGVVNVDKPSGPTSHQVSAYVQNILGINKAGHSGTLDPKVTGCLPVALGRGTRVVQSLLTAGKEYVGIMHLHKKVSREDLDKVVDKYRGTIKQLPPVKSAVKRRVRERTVYYLEILEFKDQDVLFRAGTQAGTYIRKLCHDIGNELGGGHMTELRRTKAGPFTENSLVTLQYLRDAFHLWKDDGREDLIRKAIVPVEAAVAHLPKIWVSDYAVNALCNGASLKVPGVVRLTSGIEPAKYVAVLTLKDELILVGQARMLSEKILEAERGIVVKPVQVFMQPNTYPKVETNAR